MRTLEPDARAYRSAWAVLALAVLARLSAAALVPLAPDETYYWEWSRHLAAGYLDHPPVIAWLIRLGTALFRATPFGVRIGSVLAGVLASIIVARSARVLGGDRAMLRAAAIIACMPLAQIGLGLATPDAPLMLFWSLAVAALIAALRPDVDSRARLAAWGLAGLSLGTALSSKYTALLLLASTGIALLAIPSLRRHLATPGPYVALAATLAVFAPNLIWNAEHGWSAFAYQLSHGLAVHRGSALTHELALAGGQIALVSPLLLAALAIPAARAMRDRDDDVRTTLAMIAVVTWLAFVITALRSAVEPNWQAPAYLSAIILAATYHGAPRFTRLLRAGCALGAAFTLLIYAHALVPFVPTSIALDPTASGFGWDTLAAHVDTLRHTEPTQSWIAGERYQEASELAFHLHDHPQTFVIDVHARPTQYDLWPQFSSEAHTGDRLILVLGLSTRAEDDPVIAVLIPHFTHVVLHDTVALRRGTTIRAMRRIWILDGWRGTWPGVSPRASTAVLR
ncbi:MAG: glycosyltransferase family 39 protein [Gemmatimonadaceae bacterium]